MKIFETFKCLGQILSNSLCQFWNDKSIPLQILYPSSVSWKIIPLYFFSSNNIYFAQKELITMKIFETFECSDQICQIPYANFERKSWFLSNFFIRLQFHERFFVCIFLAQTIYTLPKRSALKWKFLRLWSAWVKFCQIPYVNCERKSWFLSKFCIRVRFHERLFLCTFLARTIYTLLKRSSLKWKFLRLSSARVKFCQIRYAKFERTTRLLSKFCIAFQFHERFFLCTFLAQTIYTLLKRSSLQWKLLRLLSARMKFVKFLKPILKQKVDFSPNFVSFFTVMKDYSTLLFSLKQYMLCSKGVHYNENFGDFRVLRSNFVKFLLAIFKEQLDYSPNFVSLFGFMKNYSSVLF